MGLAPAAPRASQGVAPEHSVSAQRLPWLFPAAQRVQPGPGDTETGVQEGPSSCGTRMGTGRERDGQALRASPGLLLER